MDNPNTEAQPGDILYAKNNRNVGGISFHYMIYLRPDPNSVDHFLGAMLTSSSGYSNIALKETHFEKHDAMGRKWKVSYQASFISSDLYHKKNDWKPFTKVGQLSKEGIKFIQNKIGSKIPKFFPYNA